MYADVVFSSRYRQQQHTCEFGNPKTDVICLNGMFLSIFAESAVARSAGPIF